VVNAQQPGTGADSSEVEHGTWTRTQLAKLVAGRKVMMRGAEAQDMRVPDWLAEHADEVGDRDSSESVDDTHPDDRGRLIESFIDASAKPGALCCTIIRALDAGKWFEIEVTWLNLLDHPDVQGILCTTERLDALDIELPPEQSLAEHSATPWMILGIDVHGTIVSARGAVADILGHDASDLIDRNASEFLHPDSMASVVENWIALRQDPGRTRTSRESWVHRDGSAVWLQASFLVDENGTAEVVMVDIRDQVANEQALAASQAEVAELAEDFRLVADEVPMPVFRCDAAGRVDFRNSQWAESFPDLLEAGCLFDVFDPDSRAAVEEMLTSSQVGRTRTVEAPSADRQRMLSIQCRPVGDDPDRRRFVGSISDISDTVKLRHEATHDALTGLANRLKIKAELALAIDQDRAGVLVVYLDLDDFKSVNDTYGHDAGDAVLTELAARLSGAVRPGDLVGRQGGDEFVVICRGVGPSGGAGIVDRLKAGAFASPIEFDEGAWTAAASIGWARPEPGDDASAVLRRADEAMFAQKRVVPGRDRQSP
jgi:diguanylate cyclase (GGDEF)-like protein/PAS domain S-box-containing protein